MGIDVSPLGWLEINTDRRDSNIPLALIACEEGTRTILKKNPALSGG